MPNLSHVTNSVKLKHWSFIAKVADPKNHWRITKKGEDFLFGKISVLKTAITRDDQVLGFEGKTLNVFQVSGHYQTPENHIYEEKQADGQATLF